MNNQFLKSLQEEIAALRTELEGDPRFIKLQKLQDVLLMYQGDTTYGGIHPSQLHSSIYEPMAQSERLERRVRQPSGSRNSAIELATEFLKGRSKPTPTREIVEMLAENGISIGGKEPVSNLSAILSKSGVFTPVGRSGWFVRASEALDAAKADDSARSDDGLLIPPA